MLANAFITKWNYKGKDGMSRCYLSLLYPSQWALLSGIAGSMYSCNTYVLRMQESLQKIYSNCPLCRRGEQENGFLCWCFLFLSLNQCMHAAHRCINCKQHTGILKIGYPSWIHEWAPKFISSELVEIFWITLEKQKDNILWNNVPKPFFSVVWTVFSVSSGHSVFRGQSPAVSLLYS